MDTGFSLVIAVAGIALTLFLPTIAGRAARTAINRAAWASTKEARQKATASGHWNVVWVVRAAAFGALVSGVLAGVGLSNPDLYHGGHSRSSLQPSLEETLQRCHSLRELEDSLGGRFRPPPRSKKRR